MSRNISVERGKLVGYSVEKAHQKQFVVCLNSYHYLHEICLACKLVDELGKQCLREEDSLSRAGVFQHLK